MTDIVKRLRGWTGNEDKEDFFNTIKDAVAEIERLRNTIAQLRAVAGAVSVEGHSYADIRKEARKPFEPPDYDAFDAETGHRDR